MRIPLSTPAIVTTSFAIFSMFFGAGNLIFPIQLGQRAGLNVWYGCLGLLVTGVLFTLMGLLAVIGYEGNHHRFFGRLGNMPGTFLDLLVLIMIGPLTGLPRAITVLHEFFLKYNPNIQLFDFSIVFLLVILLATYKRERVMPLLGYLISPVLVGLLLTVIGLAWNSHLPLPTEGAAPLEAFWRGIREGYTTMDLMAAFHFAPLATTYLRRLAGNERFGIKSVTRSAAAASVITSVLLSSIYIGLSYIGALYGTALNTHNPVSLAYTITRTLLPGWLVGVFYLVVLLAITSTAISLTTIFTDYLHENVGEEHISYPQALLFTLILSGFSANGGLHAILKLELPFLIIFYPPLIMLTLCNIAHKLWGIQRVRLPVMLSFLPGLCYYWLQ